MNNEQNNKILEKYRALIKPVENQTEQIKQGSMMFQSLGEEELKDDIVMDWNSGNFFCKRIPLSNDLFFESVTGILEKDSINCVYEASSIWESKQSIINARVELMKAIANCIGAEDYHGVVITDPNRNREKQAVMLKEMATAQLFDFLEIILNPRISEISDQNSKMV